MRSVGRPTSDRLSGPRTTHRRNEYGELDDRQRCKKSLLECRNCIAIINIVLRFSYQMLGMIETVEKEIHDIQHSKLRLTANLPTCFTTNENLADYPSVCERLLKHQLLSETEPELTDCQSSSNTEQTSNTDDCCPSEEQPSKPAVISFPTKCVSLAVNEIEAKTSSRPLSSIGTTLIGSRRSHPTRSMLPRTTTPRRTSLVDKK